MTNVMMKTCLVNQKIIKISNLIQAMKCWKLLPVAQTIIESAQQLIFKYISFTVRKNLSQVITKLTHTPHTHTKYKNLSP